MTQIEFDAKMTEINNAMNNEYAYIDSLMLDNKRKRESLSASIRTSKNEIEKLSTQAMELHVRRGDIARRYHDVRNALHNEKRMQDATTNKNRIYISGAITGHDLDERKAAFAAVEKKLRERGYEPVNPFDNGLPDEATREEHMRKDLQTLLGCGSIYMLDGYGESKGAKLELQVALNCGMKVIVEGFDNEEQ